MIEENRVEVNHIPEWTLPALKGASLPCLELANLDLLVSSSYYYSLMTNAYRAMFLAFFSVNAYDKQINVPTKTNAIMAMTINTTWVTKFISVCSVE